MITLNTLDAEIQKFQLFLPEWLKINNIYMTSNEIALGKIMLMDIGVLYVSLLTHDVPNLQLSIPIMQKANGKLGQLALDLIANMPLSALSDNIGNRQEVLDKLYEYIFIKKLVDTEELQKNKKITDDDIGDFSTT